MTITALPDVSAIDVSRLHRVLEQRPGAGPLYMRAGLYLDKGDVAAAVPLVREARRLDPTDGHLDLLFQRLGGPATDDYILGRTQALMDRGCSFSSLIARHLKSAGRLGMVSEVQRFWDFERFLYRTQFNPPESEENARLAAALAQGMKFYETPPLPRSIRHGHRRDGLKPGMGDPVLDPVLARLEALITDWIASLPVEEDHPFLAARPSRFRLRGWSVVSGPETYHEMHIHPQSWSHLVLYADVPEKVWTGQGHNGCLRIGPPPEWGLDERHGFSECWLRPEPGRLVLMPSYLFHGTLPHGTTQRRSCLVMQIYPLDEERA